MDFVYRWHYPSLPRNLGETKANSTEAKFRGHRFYHEEGSIEWRRIDSQDDVAFVPCFQYTIRDHLGNGRVYFTKDYDGDNLLDVLQESHYYPFGAQLEGLSRLYDPPGSVPNASNGYVYTEEEDPTFIEYLQYTHDLKRYNGKEYNRELGLNWYDYGARWYDPVIGRWNAVDPLAENHFDITPFNYVLNNPLLLIDPDGRDTTFADNGAKELFNQTYSKIENHLGFLDKKLSKAKSEKRINKLTSQKEKLEAIKKSFDDVISSEQVFNFSTLPSVDEDGYPIQSGATTKYNVTTGEIDITVREGNDISLVHETRHGAGFEQKEWEWNLTNDHFMYYDFQDEVEAYTQAENYENIIYKTSTMSSAEIRQIIIDNYSSKKHMIKEFKQHKVPK